MYYFDPSPLHCSTWPQTAFSALMSLWNAALGRFFLTRQGPSGTCNYTPNMLSSSANQAVFVWNVCKSFSSAKSLESAEGKVWSSPSLGLIKILPSLEKDLMTHPPGTKKRDNHSTFIVYWGKARVPHLYHTNCKCDSPISDSFKKYKSWGRQPKFAR